MSAIHAADSTAGADAGANAPEPMPLYLGVDGERAFCVYHAAARGSRRNVAVLVCPPFGYEEICSYRVLREWSARLAGDGIAALRLTLTGCGDSTGTPRDPDRLGAWTATVQSATRWLREASGADAVVALGLGLGGMLTYRAAAHGAGLDGLVLWSVPARGRDLLRQLKAFSRLERAEFFTQVDPPEPLPDGDLEAGGFLLSAETVEALSRLDLSEMTPTLPLGAVLLERDGLAVDERLRSALLDHGVGVETRPGAGYEALTSHPQRAVVPEEVVAAVRSWLLQRAQPAGETEVEVAPSVAAARSAVLTLGGRRVVETPVSLGNPGARLSGVLTVPDGELAPVCAVMLNAGGVRRIGPNRMWVEAARRWAAGGAASLRLDMPGIGESDGPATPYAEDGPLYAPSFVGHVIKALDDLQARGVADRFLLVGLCAGAYWSLHAGLEDPRVTSMIMLNQVAIVWDTGTGASRDLRRVFADRSWRLVRKNATPERVRAVLALLASTPVRASRRVRARLHGTPSAAGQADAMLERLRRSDKRALFMFSVREGLAFDLRRTGKMAELESWPNVTVEPIPINDHTVRSVRVQERVHLSLDAALDRELRASPAPTATADIA